MQESRKTSPVLAWLAVLLSLIHIAPTLALAQGPSPDERARLTESQMTDEERFSLVYSLMPVVFTAEGGRRDPRVLAHVPQTAGWVKGMPRLGVPDLLLTDAGLGITNPQGGRPGDTATALPSAQAMASTFNLALARQSGAILGREARSRGFNVVLGGGMNLARDPRHGRNFEYYSEDPLLSALMAAETVKGTQGEGVIGMLKHVSLNSHEINKWFLDAEIDPAAHRDSELLAFQIGIELAEPGALMCAYNKVNGAYACGNDPILNGVIKNAVGFQGWVMSDWKAVYGWEEALKGLDQHSGAQLDEQEWFAGPLREAYGQGRLPKERLSDMVRRILRSVYAVGIDRWGPTPEVDMAAHHAAALDVARQGIVLLKNEGMLPLAADTKRIAMIGGFAHVGVMGGGGGSSQVTPPGGFAVTIPLGGEGVLAAVRRQVFIAPGPLAELKKLLPQAAITYNSGEYPAEAAALARRSDVVILVATKFETEGFDSPDLSLPLGQDVLIDAVASANPNAIVVLQTGNPVDMPWRGKVKAIVQAWYPGQAGGQAIAEVLWLARTGATPLYAFGHGLSYTNFGYSDLTVSGGETTTARFTVTNTGQREGADVPQLYLTEAAGDKRLRLLGFERVELKPGESRQVTLTADPRLLARFDAGAGQWRITEGTYRVALGTSADDLVLTAEAPLTSRMLGR